MYIFGARKSGRPRVCRRAELVTSLMATAVRTSQPCLKRIFFRLRMLPPVSRATAAQIKTMIPQRPWITSPFRYPHFFIQSFFSLENVYKNINNDGIKLCSGVFDQFFDRMFPGQGLTVDAIGSHGVITVGYG